MKVYLVINNTAYDYDVRGIYDNFDAAIEMLDKLKLEYSDVAWYGPDYFFIEECIVNSGEPPKIVE